MTQFEIFLRIILFSYTKHHLCYLGEEHESMVKFAIVPALRVKVTIVRTVTP
jgi:hypothetical protein